MQTLGFVIVAAAILGFGFISGRIRRSPITPPMIFVLMGLAVGRLGLGLGNRMVSIPWPAARSRNESVIEMDWPRMNTDGVRLDMSLLK